jgi:hypothetical protein
MTSSCTLDFMDKQIPFRALIVVSKGGETETASFAASPSAYKVTTNARCEKDGNNRTCTGSRWGDCCSQHSYVSHVNVAFHEWLLT